MHNRVDTLDPVACSTQPLSANSCPLPSLGLQVRRWALPSTSNKEAHTDPGIGLRTAWVGIQLPKSLNPGLKERAWGYALSNGPHPLGPIAFLFHEEGTQSGPRRGRDSCCLGISLVQLTLVLSSSWERNSFHAFKQEIITYSFISESSGVGFFDPLSNSLPTTTTEYAVICIWGKERDSRFRKVQHQPTGHILKFSEFWAMIATWQVWDPLSRCLKMNQDKTNPVLS